MPLPSLLFPIAVDIGPDRQRGVSQPCHYWLFGLDNSLLRMGTGGVFSAHYRLFDSIPCPSTTKCQSHLSLSSSQVMTKKKVSRHCHMSPAGKITLD